MALTAPRVQRGMQLTTREDPLHQGFGIALEPLPFGFAMRVFSAGAMRDERDDAQIAFKAVIWMLFLHDRQTG